MTGRTVETEIRGSRRTLWVFGLLVCVATVVLVFLLPLFVPVAPSAVISITYMTGFNTRAADVAAIVISCAVLWAAWRGFLAQGGNPPPATRMGWRFTLAILSATLTALSLACWVVTRADIRYPSDAGYFREQLLSYAVNGRHLYTGLEFPYGPLLMGLPAWIYRGLWPSGASITASYFISLVIAQMLGMMALAYAMNRLPIRDGHRRIGFALFCAGACVPLLGLNYTLLRFALPMTLLLFIAEQRDRRVAIALLTAGELLELAISPEVGLAFLAACWAYSTWRWRGNRRYMAAGIIIPALAAAIFLWSCRSYLRMLIAFGHGALNLPLQPLPHILIFLVALIWLAPRSVGTLLHRQTWRSDRDEGAAVLVGIYGFALCMVPSTFARCDPLHVYFNGIAAFVLSLVAVGKTSVRSGRAWLFCLVALVFWMQGVNLYLDRRQIAEAVHAGLPSLPASARRDALRVMAWIVPKEANIVGQPVRRRPLDVERLEAIIGKNTVATPLEIDWATEQQLRQSDHFRPDFYCYMTIFSLAAEQQKVHDFNTAEWALLPQPLERAWSEGPEVLGLLQGIDLHYPVRHPMPYLRGALLLEDIQDHWRPVADFGLYRLYRHRR